VLFRYQVFGFGRVTTAVFSINSLPSKSIAIFSPEDTSRENTSREDTSRENPSRLFLVSVIRAVPLLTCKDIPFSPAEALRTVPSPGCITRPLSSRETFLPAPPEEEEEMDIFPELNSI